MLKWLQAKCYKEKPKGNIIMAYDVHHNSSQHKGIANEAKA